MAVEIQEDCTLFQIQTFTKKFVVLSSDFVAVNQRRDRLPLNNSTPRTFATRLGNKGRFCKTIALVTLVHTSIQSD